MNRTITRLIAVTAAVLVAYAGVQMIRIANNTSSLRTRPVVIVEVRPGDTWWSIARTCDGTDIRSAVNTLAARTSTDPDRPLVPGQLVAACAPLR